MPERTHAPIKLDGRTFFLVTLGCFKNEVESDLLRSRLTALGMREVRAVDESDVILVNTCGFIEDSRAEGIDTILELDSLASAVEPRPPLVVVGCMVQGFASEMAREMPEIDALLGIGWEDGLEAALTGVLSGAGKIERPGRPVPTTVERTVDTGEGATLYVRVSDGCSRGCSFCTIPRLRGPHRSRPLESIVEELERLSRGREREVVLLAQDLTAYGRDRPGGPGLVELIEAVSSLECCRRLRTLYLQPESVSDELIEAIAGNPRVCDYFDLPFQHASRAVLERMNRSGDTASHARLLSRIRDAAPEAAIRSTVMVAFPGEGEREFEELCEFVEMSELDWLGAFCYSSEAGTRAASLEGGVPREIAHERYRRILEVQEAIEARRSQSMVGRTLEVAVDGRCDVEPFAYEARSYREAPIADGVIYLKRSADRGSGDLTGTFVNVRVTGTEGLDLVAEVERHG